MKSTFVEGEDTTLRCRCNVGKPAGTLYWSRQRAGYVGYRNVVVGSRSILARRHDDGTSTVVSELRVRLSAEDDGAVFRCVVRAGEDELFNDKKVTVLCE